MTKLEIFDSTLRDGAQGEGISFSVSDKLSIVRTLDAFGVDYIEAGNPGSNPKDIEFFKRVAELTLTNARLCAFGSTCRKETLPEEDQNVLSLLDAGTPSVAIFGKTWDLHVLQVLNTTLTENLRLVSDTVRFFKQRGKEVIFDAEHFFDGFLNNPAYAMKVLTAAHEAGADVLCLCDTNGGTLPDDLRNVVFKVCNAFPGARIGIHCHNDGGCAVASSLMAVRAGAVQVQGTLIGIGERCGNADLSAILPSLKLKMGLDCKGNLPNLRHTAMRIAELCNLQLASGKPYVGASAFAHKGGMHIDGVSKVSCSFEHIPPESVGNERRFLMSEVSGRTTVLAKLATVAPELQKNSPEVAQIVARIKDLEHEGFQFEAADASFELMVLKALGRFTPHFTLSMYRISGEYPFPDGDQSASAMLSIQVDGTPETTAAMGNGPVHALDTALRKALAVFYPELTRVRLTDYKVRVLTGMDATASTVRVLIESSDGEISWTTVGVSTDIIAASWQALTDSIEYILHKKEADAQCQ
ncbi:MAG TPA: citramalate synthase [Candidatus Limiplasma sp.]|nr:citramalate synthase [Candidatus Limiplasma sp.]HPS81069.1 citramalate synthase [Candidatus Limiplasma sp.]